MSGHIQIPVQKQGSYATENWSDRTLTIDVATETATISRHDHPKDLYHHSMRVLGVQKWPELKVTNSGHGHNSPEAKMTLHLIGVKVPVQKFGNDDAKSTTSAGTGTHTPCTGSTTPGERPSPGNGPASSEVDDSWMIRCTSQESYEAAVKLLEEIAHLRHMQMGSHGAHNDKDEEALKRFALPANATAPAVVPAGLHAPMM
jgi:hypothetical protein